jgi:hypothetical protein
MRGAGPQARKPTPRSAPQFVERMDHPGPILTLRPSLCDWYTA